MSLSLFILHSSSPNKWPTGAHSSKGGGQRVALQVYARSCLLWHRSPPPVAGNSHRECFSCTLHNLLCSQLVLRKRDGACYLSQVAFSYNTTAHQSLTKAPFFLTFGQDPHLSVYFPLGRVQEAEVSSRPDWSEVDKMPCVWSTANHLEDTIKGCKLRSDQHDHRARFSSTWQLVHRDCAQGVGGSVCSTPFPFILPQFNELLYFFVVCVSLSWIIKQLMSSCGYRFIFSLSGGLAGCCP